MGNTQQENKSGLNEVPDPVESQKSEIKDYCDQNGGNKNIKSGPVFHHENDYSGDNRQK